jgi:plastocyanin
MHSIARPIGTLVIAAVFAACSGGGNPTAAPAGSSGGGGAAGGAPCADSSGTTTVSAAMQGFAFTPNQITAKVGDVITWDNKDTAPHGVALDDGSCKMSNAVQAGQKGSLTFTKAGTYPFHCFVHPNMKGTITIS